ncbi:MAG: trehalose 2-sulfotransferase [Solirubrobacteraceae bacterium]|nr:trehalose 2-sulfotransferase [Solirubrobacteraceae bacterium]
MPEPGKSYLVCATQRSGSTLLCELLKGTGVAGRPEEFFEAVRDTGLPPHPGDYLTGLPPTGVGVRNEPTPPEGPAYSSLLGISDYRHHLERTFAWGTTANGVFGAKLMWNQVPELRALAGELPEFAGLETAQLLERLFGSPRYIWVSRNDKVRQAVSLWRALQVRSWRHGDTGNGRGSPQYRFRGIHHLVTRLQSEDRGWEQFFSGHGLQPLKISYEDDLEGNPDGAIDRALSWIGVLPPQRDTVRQPLRRQADALSDAWVAAYHRDVCTATGAPSDPR